MFQIRRAGILMLLFMMMNLGGARAQQASPPPASLQPVVSAQPVSDVIAEIVRVDPSDATLGQPIVVDFQVNGANFPACDQTFRAPVRVLLVFDRSGSMQINTLLAPAQGAANIFIDLLDASQDEIGLLSFSGDFRLDQMPTKNYVDVRNKLAGLSAGGGTSTGSAIQEATRILGADQGANLIQPVILLLTDGMPDDADSAIAAAHAANDAGIIVLAINAGYSAGEPILRQMVQNPATDYFFAPTPADLEIKFAEAIKTFERLALVGTSVSIVERFADGYVPVAGSIVPEDGQIVGNTIEWRLPRLARRDTVVFSYRVQPATLDGRPFSTGQQVAYTDCNNAAQSLIAPVSRRSAVSVIDPATLTFGSTPRNQSFLGPEDRPQTWLRLGLGMLSVAVLGSILWLLTRRRRTERTP